MSALPGFQGRCSTCAAPVFWSITALGAAIPVEALPDRAGTVHALSLPGGRVVARVYRRRVDPSPPRSEIWFVAHHVGCSGASLPREHRCPVCGWGKDAAVVAHSTCDPEVAEQEPLPLFADDTGTSVREWGETRTFTSERAPIPMREFPTGDAEALQAIAEGAFTNRSHVQRVVKTGLRAAHEAGALTFVRLDTQASPPVFHVIAGGGRARALPGRIAAAWLLGMLDARGEH